MLEEDSTHPHPNGSSSVFYLKDFDLIRKNMHQTDVLQLFKILKKLKMELILMKLENNVFQLFLQRNNPDALSELHHSSIAALRKKKIQFALHSSEKVSKPQPRTVRNSSLQYSFGIRAFRTSDGKSRRIVSRNTSLIPKESFKSRSVNYMMKYEMVQYNRVAFQANIDKIIEKTRKTLINLRAQNKENAFRIADINATISKFEENVEFYNQEPLKTCSEKYVKYFYNWFKNASALLSTMRLQLVSIRQYRQQAKITLETKKALSGTLKPVDFEKMRIAKELEAAVLEEKLILLTDLKQCNNHASFELNTQKKQLINNEKACKMSNDLIVTSGIDLQDLNEKLEIVRQELTKWKTKIDKIQLQIQSFESPSVTEYLHKKEVYNALQKSIKYQKRKIYINEIKLENLLQNVSKMKRF